eukprot:14117347-Alexandrium_andersonii.AAC.1
MAPKARAKGAPHGPRRKREATSIDRRAQELIDQPREARLTLRSLRPPRRKQEQRSQGLSQKARGLNMRSIGVPA